MKEGKPSDGETAGNAPLTQPVVGDRRFLVQPDGRAPTGPGGESRSREASGHLLLPQDSFAAV